MFTRMVLLLVFAICFVPSATRVHAQTQEETARQIKEKAMRLEVQNRDLAAAAEQMNAEMAKRKADFERQMIEMKEKMEMTRKRMQEVEAQEKKMMADRGRFDPLVAKERELVERQRQLELQNRELRQREETRGAERRLPEKQQNGALRREPLRLEMIERDLNIVPREHDIMIPRIGPSAPQPDVAGGLKAQHIQLMIGLAGLESRKVELDRHASELRGEPFFQQAALNIALELADTRGRLSQVERLMKDHSANIKVLRDKQPEPKSDRAPGAEKQKAAKDQNLKKKVELNKEDRKKEND